MAETNPGNQSSVRKFGALLGHSAEYSIAFALLVVCLIVGIAVWLLQPGAPATKPNTQLARPTQTHSTANSGDDEQAALGAWNEKMQGGFDQADQRRSVESRKEIQERKQQAQEPPPKPQADKPVAVAAPAPAPVAAPRVVVAPAPVVAALPKPAAVRTNAAIDWTTCKRPSYPETSIRKNEEGAVVIDVDLAADAHIINTRVAQSSGHERLDTTTQRAIEKCKFRSATLDGQPQASTASVKFTWALQKK